MPSSWTDPSSWSWSDNPIFSVNVRPGSAADAARGNEFTDIDKAKEWIRNPTGTSIGDNDLLQDKYNFRYRVFPEDLTNQDVGHYMVININTPTDIKGTGTPRTYYTGEQNRTSVLSEQYSKVDILRFGNRGGPGTGYRPLPGTNPAATSAGTPSEGVVLPRGTRRIEESIALFMPNPIIYSSTNAYEEASLTAMAGSVVTGVVNSVAAIGGAILSP